MIRQWTHPIAILAIEVWIGSLYVLGLGTTGFHIVGIPRRSLLGYGPVATLGMPMALGHLALVTWLIAKGLPRVIIAAPGPEAR